MFLIDTNIWVELLLEQERANEVQNLFENINSEELYITDFTIYSIGIILFKLHKKEVLKLFLNKTIIESNINKIVLDETELSEMIDDEEYKKLDFDDAYQYYSAKKMGINIVSFDADFERA